MGPYMYTADGKTEVRQIQANFEGSILSSAIFSAMRGEIMHDNNIFRKLAPFRPHVVRQPPCASVSQDLFRNNS